MQQAASEQRFLRLSIGVTIIVALFGLLSGSLSIVFDGMFAAIDIAEALGGEGPRRWLTIDFTADPHWP